MSYNQQLADLIRAALTDVAEVEEKDRMGGRSFMVRGKLCLRATGDDLMLGCNPDDTERFLTQSGVRRFTMKGKPTMKGWLLLGPEVWSNPKAFAHWIAIALEWNRKLTTTHS